MVGERPGTASRKTQTPGFALATGLHTVSVAALVGASAGLVEGVILAGAGSTVMTFRAAVNVSVLYGLLFGLAGVLIAAVHLAVGAATGWRSATSRARWLLGSGAAVLVVLVISGAYINELFLPAMISTQALVADAVLVAACALLWWLVYRFGREWSARMIRLRGWRAPGSVAWLLLVLALVLVGAASSEPGAQPAERGRTGASKDLNILLLVVDAMRADHLACHEYGRSTSPNIDALAAEGVLFRRAYSHGSRTKESTASLVTSLYPSSHNVTHMANAIPTTCSTLMSVLQANGYRTAVFSANPLVSPLFGFGRGVDHFCARSPIAERLAIVPQTLRKPTLRLGALLALERRLEHMFPLATARTAFQGGRADTLNRGLLDWLDEDREAGFFAYVHYMEPHIPYAPPPPFDRLFDPDYEGERVTTPPLPSGPTFVPYGRDTELSPREFQNLVAQYDGSISYADHEIGRLLSELDERGLLERTLVIVTSDHGEELYDRGGWSHGHTVHEELVRVPMILWCPSRLPEGLVVDGVVRHIDVMPTILGAVLPASSERDTTLEGVDLWPFIAGGADLASDLPAFSEVFSAGSCARSLRVGPHKVIQIVRGADTDYRLYDLSNDPGERTDLSVTRPELLRFLRDELERTVAEAESKRSRARSRVVDEETRERLESLGYVM